MPRAESCSIRFTRAGVSQTVRPLRQGKTQTRLDLWTTNPKPFHRVGWLHPIRQGFPGATAPQQPLGSPDRARNSLTARAARMVSRRFPDVHAAAM